MLHAKMMVLCLVGAGLLPIEVLHCENWDGFSTFFAPVTFIYNLDPIVSIYTKCANMNFLCQGFLMLSSARQIDRHDRNYTPRHFMGGQQVACFTYVYKNSQTTLSNSAIPLTDR